MTCATTSVCISVTCSDLAIEPACLNLSMMRETDNEIEITITDGDGKAIAIGADTIDFTVKDELGGSVIFTKQNGPGGHSDPDLGQTIFTIAKADTSTASETTTTYWTYEVRRTTAALEERVHIQGDFVVRPTI
jgi:hypothetical protein